MLFFIVASCQAMISLIIMIMVIINNKLNFCLHKQYSFFGCYVSNCAEDSGLGCHALKMMSDNLQLSHSIVFYSQVLR